MSERPYGAEERDDEAVPTPPSPQGPGPDIDLEDALDAGDLPGRPTTRPDADPSGSA